MPSPKYETTAFELDLKRADRYVVDFDELIIEEPKPSVKDKEKGA